MNDRLSDNTARCLLAVLTGARSVAEVATLAGVRSTETAHRHLCRLREEGLVDWEPGKAGTLRATCGATWTDVST